MDRRVPSRRREIHGAVLEISTSNGYSVLYDGAYLGYIHASVGDRWNTYRRVPNSVAAYLGKFNQTDAVDAILRAAAAVCVRAS